VNAVFTLNSIPQNGQSGSLCLHQAVVSLKNDKLAKTACLLFPYMVTYTKLIQLYRYDLNPKISARLLLNTEGEIIWTEAFISPPLWMWMIFCLSAYRMPSEWQTKNTNSTRLFPFTR
jgi:hypothetical protein